MICPKCSTTMVVGVAIRTNCANTLYIMAPAPIRANELQLIRCLKCPKCGHSDDLR